MKPNPKEEAKRWLLQAEHDLEFAGLGLREGFYGHVCFLAQQSAEKSLKALVYLGGARLVLGHSAGDLLEGLLERHPQLEKHREVARRLDQYYITPRYPNALPGPGLAPFQVFTQGQAREAIDGVDAIIRGIRELIGQ